MRLQSASLSPRGRAHALALATALMWSLAFVCIRDVVTQLRGAGATVWEAMLALFLARISLGAVLYLPHLVLHGRQLRGLGWGGWGLLALTMAVGTYGYHLPLNHGAQFLNSGMVSLLIALSPVFAAVMGWLLLRERLGLARLAGVALGLGGVGLCLHAQGHLDWELGTEGLLAPASVLMSAVCGALFSLAGRKLPRQLPRGVAMGVALVAAALLGLPLWNRHLVACLEGLTWRGWLGLTYLAACCLYLASILWLQALRELEAAEVTIYLNLTTALALVWGVLLYGEAITGTFMFGAGGVVGAIVLVNWPRRLPPAPVPDIRTVA